MSVYRAGAAHRLHFGAGICLSNHCPQQSGSLPFQAFNTPWRYCEEFLHIASLIKQGAMRVTLIPYIAGSFNVGPLA